MPFAVKAADVATPVPSVTAVVTPPANAPLAPLPGAANVTVTPLNGLLLESFTIALSVLPNIVLMAALWGDPPATAIDAGTAVLTVKVSVRVPVAAVGVAVSVTVTCTVLDAAPVGAPVI